MRFSGGIAGRVLAATAVVAMSTAAIHAPAAAAQAASPPGLGPAGTATVHGDVAATDTLPGRGPGANPAIQSSLTGATCSTVFVGSDGMPVALCTAYVGLNPPTPLAPTVKLFHPDTADVLAEVQLAKGALLGGVYGYLDDRDRVVVADGNSRLLAVGHERGGDGVWRMNVEVLADLSAGVPDGDAVTGLVPAFDGRIWYATSGGTVGIVRPGNDASLRTLTLPAGEKITNGLTVRPGGASVITSRALYEVDSHDDEAALSIRWRHGYDVGPARKPGLLAHGSGTTPSYFGPDDQLVAITDDSDRPELIVMRRDDGSEVCRMPAFATTLDPSSAAPDGVLIEGPAATENSIIAFGDALVLVNTYGFQYPPFAVDGPAVPATAQYTGGMTRIDVGPDGDCSRAWTSLSRTASLPKLTTDDGLIHAMAYGPPGAHPVLDRPVLDQGLAQKFGPVDVTSTDVETGREVVRQFVGHAPLDEPMELTGTIDSRGDAPGVMWQPTLTRMLRIGPA